MLDEKMIGNLKKEITRIYNKKTISEEIFFICSSCRRQIIESVIEDIYRINNNKCHECAILRRKALIEVFEILEVIYPGRSIPPKKYFEDRIRRKTLIAIINGIYTIGANIPCIFPHICSIELTYRCNLKCQHCYLGTPPNIDEMNLETMLGLIRDIAETGFVGIVLSGGEPLLRDDLITIMKEIKKYELEVILSTNGILLSEDKVRTLRPQLDLVCISLDSDVQKIHDDFRGVDGAHEATLRAINNCLKNDVRVRIFTTLTKFNYDRLPEFVQFIKKLGVGEIGFFDLNPVGKGIYLGEDVQLTVGEYKEAVKKIHELNISSKMHLDVLAPYNFRIDKEYANMTTLLSGGFCNAGISTLNITPDGYIQPCSRLRVNIGNVKDEKIKNVWKNSEILKSIRERDKLKGVCGECKYKYFCGGCRANAYSKKKDFLGEDPRCI